MSDSTNVKNVITRYVKSNKQLHTDLGTINITDRILGEGGNALVYPVDIGAPAAVKLLAEDARNNSTRYTRFKNEYQRLVSLPYHSGLIQLYHFDVVQIEDLMIPIIIMEKCDSSLDKTRINGNITSEFVTRIALELCESLEHMHNNGIIHRDIKPENILIRANGSTAIADFGIAWFDPDIYNQQKLTRKGDRLANFKFSAPEQLENECSPTPATDIYALGLALYWLVAGDVIKGTHPRSLIEFDKSYELLDAIIPKMIRQDPSDRPQSCREVIELIRNNNAVEDPYKRPTYIIKCLDEFERRVRSSLPGQYGIIHINDNEIVDRVLNTLSTDSESYELWWTRGIEDYPIERMIKLENSIWIVDDYELKITDMWVGHKYGSHDHCFVLIRSDTMPSFGIYPSIGHDYGIAALFNGDYIDYDHYMDGYTIIDGKSVAITENDVRTRYLRPFYVFLTTNYNPIHLGRRHHSKADEIITGIISDIESTDNVDVDALGNLFRLPRHTESMMMD